MSYIKSCKLENIISYISRGITPKYTDDKKLSCMVLNQKCVRNHRIDYKPSRLNNLLDRKVANEKFLKIYDVLINSTGTGTLGRVSQLTSEIKEKITFDSHITVIRANDKEIDPLFLGYLLKFNQENIENLAQGSTGQTELSRESLKSLEVKFISNKLEQNKNADILHKIDLKIDINTQTAQTLETIAQTIFKSWFVDFDPIHAKINAIENGEDPTLAAMQTISCKNSEELDRLQTENPQEYRKLEELANAFPSEIGDDSVPKGWESRELSGLFEFIGGSQPPKTQHIYEEKEGYERFIQNRDFSSENHKTYIPISKRNKRCTEKDILMDKYGDAGRVRFGISGAYNVALARINPINSNLREFLRWYFSQDKIRNYLNASSMASTRNSLNSTSFTALEIVVPSDVILNHFETIIDVHVSKVLQIKEENRNLEKLREILLPRLLKGEI